MCDVQNKCIERYKRRLYVDVVWGFIAFLQFGAMMLAFNNAYKVAVAVCVGWVLSRMIASAITSMVILRELSMTK